MMSLWIGVIMNRHNQPSEPPVTFRTKEPECQLGTNEPKDIDNLIQKVNKEIDALELEQVVTKVQRQIEKPVAINAPPDLAPYIEHTLLNPDATRKDIIRLCDEAKQYGFRGVCVNPVFVKNAHQELKGTNCLAVSVVGFPLGANLTITKVEETKQVINLGTAEVDMVIAIGALKEHNYKKVYEDIRAVVEAASQTPVKVIIEAGLLEKNEKIAACLLALRGGAAFVKTSTGFNSKVATVEDVKLMRAVVEDKIGIKAAGGMRNFKTARALLEAGANRLGCSASITIVTESIQNEQHNLQVSEPPKSEIAFKYAWDWFSYHAAQRLNAFHFFLIIIGFVVIGYSKSMELGQKGQLLGVFLGLFGALTSIAFMILDIRNTELVNCGRAALDNLEGKVGLTIRRDDKTREYFLTGCPILKPLLKPIVNHGFWFRLIQLLTSIAFLFAAIYALRGFVW